jgi:hypothetical protein
MMRKLLCLLLWASAAPLALAQTLPSATQAPAATSKDDDTLLIDLVDTPEATWRQLAQLLVQRGYAIEHSSNDLLTLATYPMVLDNQAIRVAGTVVKQTLWLRVYWANEVSNPHHRARRRGGNSAEWRELVAIGQQMGGKVRYTVSTAPE